MKSVTVSLVVKLKVELEEDEPEINAIKEIETIVQEALQGGFTVFEDLVIKGSIVEGV